MILTITIPDAHAQAVLDAFATRHHYRPTLLMPDPADPSKLAAAPNPETLQAFVERILREYVANVLHAHRQSLVVLPKAEF